MCYGKQLTRSGSGSARTAAASCGATSSKLLTELVHQRALQVRRQVVPARRQVPQPLGAHARAGARGHGAARVARPHAAAVARLADSRARCFFLWGKEYKQVRNRCSDIYINLGKHIWNNLPLLGDINDLLVAHNAPRAPSIRSWSHSARHTQHRPR